MLRRHFPRRVGKPYTGAAYYPARSAGVLYGAAAQGVPYLVAAAEAHPGLSFSRPLRHSPPLRRPGASSSLDYFPCVTAAHSSDRYSAEGPNERRTTFDAGRRGVMITLRGPRSSRTGRRPIWLRGRELNPRRCGYEPHALPLGDPAVSKIESFSADALSALSVGPGVRVSPLSAVLSAPAGPPPLSASDPRNPQPKPPGPRCRLTRKGDGRECTQTWVHCQWDFFYGCWRLSLRDC